MSDDDGDLFADSDDTAELMASKPEPKKAAAKKKLGGAAKRKRNEGKGKKIPDADDDDDDKGGLFDSDDDDDEPAAKKTKPLTKKEKMEALRKKRAGASGSQNDRAVSSVPGEDKKKPRKEGADGYDSEDSYNSGNFQLTEDDRNFIDTEGDDADAINELYSEQHFDDRRGEAEEDDMVDRRKKGRKGGGASRSGGSRGEKLDPEADPDNPIMAAVGRMKKKKREQKSITEKEDECKTFMDNMERAAEEDELAVKERRPATKKLAMLNSVVDMFNKKDMTRVLLDLDVLSICRRWIQPLPNGTLGNVTIRSRLLDSIANMNGDGGITPNDLKKSEFGKVVMSIYMHKSETPSMKRKLKALIEQWSRPIFQKSGNMRDLERVHSMRGDAGLAGISRDHRHDQRQREAAAAKRPTQGRTKADLAHMLKSGKKTTGSQLNRVRVPYSKGFQFTVRPSAKNMEKSPEKGAGRGQEARDNLSKRMMEKNRAVSKNQRSANISVEGRATK